MPYLTSPRIAQHRLTPTVPESLWHTVPLPQFIPCRFHKGMPFLVTFTAQRLQVGWMISTMFGQLKDMVTVAILVWHRMQAVLTDALVPLVYKLFELYPIINLRTTVPRETHAGNFIYCESSHALPFRTDFLPRLTLPCRYRFQPRQCVPLSCRTLATKQKPYLALRRQSRPRRALPRLTTPYIDVATKELLVNLKLDHVEATKAGAIIANADCLTGQGQDILQETGLDFVIIDDDFKVKFPARGECRTDANHAGALDNYRAHVKVKRLVGICIQFIRDGKANVRNAVRLDKDIGAEQVFISFTALARDLEADRGLYQRALKVAGRLVDLSVSIGIKIFAPLLGIVLSARGSVAALAEVGEIGHRETVLHKWCSSFDTYRNGIHGFILSTIQRAAILLRLMLSRIRRLQNSGPLLANKKRLIRDAQIIAQLTGFEYGNQPGIGLGE